jgi:hypothetical protein
MTWMPTWCIDNGGAASRFWAWARSAELRRKSPSQGRFEWRLRAGARRGCSFRASIHDNFAPEKREAPLQRWCCLLSFLHATQPAAVNLHLAAPARLSVVLEKLTAPATSADVNSTTADRDWGLAQGEVRSDPVEQHNGPARHATTATEPDSAFWGNTCTCSCCPHVTRIFAGSIT